MGFWSPAHSVPWVERGRGDAAGFILCKSGGGSICWAAGTRVNSRGKILSRLLLSPTKNRQCRYYLRANPFFLSMRLWKLGFRKGKIRSFGLDLAKATVLQQFCIPFSKEDSFLISEFKLNSLVGVKKREKEKGSKIDRKIFKNAFRLIYNLHGKKKKKH